MQESFYEVLITSCIVEGMDNYSWSDNRPNSTCPQTWPWKLWKKAIALKHDPGTRLFLLRLEELSAFLAPTIKKIYRFLQLPTIGYVENIADFTEAYNMGAKNGIGETSRSENTLRGWHDPMGIPSSLLVRKILRHDTEFPKFLEKIGFGATQKDMEFP